MLSSVFSYVIDLIFTFDRVLICYFFFIKCEMCFFFLVVRRIGLDGVMVICTFLMYPFCIYESEH